MINTYFYKATVKGKELSGILSGIIELDENANDYNLIAKIRDTVNADRDSTVKCEYKNITLSHLKLLHTVTDYEQVTRRLKIMDYVTIEPNVWILFDGDKCEPIKPNVRITVHEAHCVREDASIECIMYRFIEDIDDFNFTFGNTGLKEGEQSSNYYNTLE